MKLLITGGCSFSECISINISTWPKHLANILSDRQHISTAMGSQGNGLISRKLIYQIQRRIPTDDLLVGVIWSGPDRHDFYLNRKLSLINEDKWMENPTNVIEESPGGWVITNPWWSNEYSKDYYKIFHDSVGQLVYSYEHILRLQLLLEKHNIKYFMGTYTNEVFPEYRIRHPEVKYLYDMIDRSKFLPVEGVYEWCRDYSKLDFPVPDDPHPSSEQHGLFTQEVIVPFLKEKNYI